MCVPRFLAGIQVDKFVSGYNHACLAPWSPSTHLGRQGPEPPSLTLEISGLHTVSGLGFGLRSPSGWSTHVCEVLLHPGPPGVTQQLTAGVPTGEAKVLVSSPHWTACGLGTWAKPWAPACQTPRTVFYDNPVLVGGHCRGPCCGRRKWSRREGVLAGRPVPAKVPPLG